MMLSELPSEPTTNGHRSLALMKGTLFALTMSSALRMINSYKSMAEHMTMSSRFPSSEEGVLPVEEKGGTKEFPRKLDNENQGLLARGAP
jgi:hypothetical protein